MRAKHAAYSQITGGALEVVPVLPPMLGVATAGAYGRVLSESAIASGPAARG